MRDREHLVQLWLAKNEHIALKLLSQSEEANMSETIRRLIRDQAKEIGVWPIQAPADGAKIKAA